MSEIHNTATNVQQTQADVGSARKAGALVDRRAVGSFYRTIHECAAKAANAAGVTGGFLGLAGYGERLVVDGFWQENSPRNKSRGPACDHGPAGGGLGKGARLQRLPIMGPPPKRPPQQQAWQGS
jgi:hypothetical protein